MEQRPDHQLMRAFVRGDEAAFDALVQRHGQPLKAYALRMLRSPELAEEVYVESFVRVARAKDRWSPKRGTFRSWLFTIAHRLCIDELRRRRVEQEAQRELVALAERRPVLPSPEALAELGQLAHQLEEALQQLPEEHREVLLLRLVHGLTGDETAAALELDRTQVDSKLAYARRRLKRLLAEPLAEGSGR